MHTFIAHARQRRLAIATSAVLVLMAIHGAAPATAGGGSISGGGIEFRQGASTLYGGGIGGSGNASGGSIENRGTLPPYTSHSVEMEKISGMAQATLPTILKELRVGVSASLAASSQLLGLVPTMSIIL
jgi:hypothetical protein